MTPSQSEGRASQIGDELVHVVVKDAPKFTVAVTQHPVERGANIADHARPQLTTLSLECIISDLDGGNPIGADYYFRGLKGQPRVIAVDVPSGYYDSMVVTDYQPKLSKSDGNSLRFTMELIEWRVVSTRKATVQVVQAKQVKKGAKPPEQKKPTAHQSALDKALVGKPQAGVVTQEELQRGQSLPTQHGGQP